MGDIEKAIRASRHFEDLLTHRYRARGSGLSERARHVARNLPKAILDDLLYVAEVRNTLAHEKIDSIPDQKRFDEACAALEAFFRESISTTDENSVCWVERVAMGLSPVRLASSVEKRLYYYFTGDIRVKPPGIYYASSLLRFVGLDHVGHVRMVPQSLPPIKVSPLASKDQTYFELDVGLTTVVQDNDECIKKVVLSADDQMAFITNHVIAALQKTCVNYAYRDLYTHLDEIGAEIRRTVNTRMDEETGSFRITGIAIYECRLQDIQMAEIRARRIRLAEEASLKEELMQQQAKIDELQRNAANAKAEHERKLQVEESKNEITLRENKTTAEKKELELFKVKAEIAALKEGKYVLFPQQTFALENQRLRTQAELLRATFSDRKLQQLMELALSAGATQAQVQTIKDLMEQTLNVKLSERSLGSQDGDGSTEKPSTEPLQEKKDT